MRKRNNQRGVTLIELMIIMIIVNILSVAIFESMTASVEETESARERDREEQRLIEAKQQAARDAMENYDCYARSEDIFDLAKCASQISFRDLGRSIADSETLILSFMENESGPIMDAALSGLYSKAKKCDEDDNNKLSEKEVVTCLQSTTLYTDLVDLAKELGQTYFPTDDRNKDYAVGDEYLLYLLKLHGQDVLKEVLLDYESYKNKKAKQKLKKKVKQAKLQCKY